MYMLRTKCGDISLEAISFWRQNGNVRWMVSQFFIDFNGSTFFI